MAPSVVDCAGDGKSRGHAHGEALRSMVAGALERWKDSLAESGTSNVDSFVRQLVDGTSLVRTCERWAPDLLDEIRGIAEAASVSERELIAYNFMDEQWWLPSEEAVERGCSVVGLVPSSTGPVLLAQNMDLPRAMDDSQIVLRIRPLDASEALVLSAAGLIGLTGVTRAGLGVCVNALLMLEHSAAGLPVAFVIRKVLTTGNLGEAENLLKALPHASGQHYAVADTSGVRGFECSASSCATIASDGSGWLAHTNHPLVSSDIDSTAESRLRERGVVESSQARLQFLQMPKRLDATVADIKRLLSDRSIPVCVSRSDRRPSLTFGSMIFEMSTPPVVHVCLGPPDADHWMSVDWS